MTNQTPESVIAEALVNAGAPLMHSRVEEAVAGALRKAGMLAEQSGQVCAWCPSPARGSAHHNDGKLHPSCGQVSHGQGWVPDYPVERIGAIEAERDAALAAIERVRAIADDGVWRDTKTSGDWAWALDHMAHKILAALDGAPEPEWEYRYAEIHDDSEMYTYGPRDNADGCFDTAEDARDERIEDTDVVVRRPKRPASEWEVCE